VPDAATWVGGAVILSGIVLVTYSEHAKNQEALAGSRYEGLEAVASDSSHSGRGGDSHLGSGGSSRGGSSSGHGSTKTPPRSDESRFEYHLPELDADVGHEDFGFLLDYNSSSSTSNASPSTSFASSSPSSSTSSAQGRAGGAGQQRPRQARVVGLESALAL
jgi:hypothetical protein